MSTPTDTEFTGEENSTGTAQQTQEHPPFQHVHADGSVHYSDQPDCGGLCPDRPGTPPAVAPDDQ